MENEIWKDIEGYEGLYKLSNKGKVERLQGVRGLNSKLLIPTIDRRGSLVINLNKDGKRKNYALGKLVFTTFNTKFDLRNFDSIIYYKDKNKQNVDINNLYQRKKKEIICVTTEKVFNSSREAGRYYKCYSSPITECCKNKVKTCGKLKDGTKLTWMYLEEYKKLTKEEIELRVYNANKSVENGNLNKPFKKVFCITTETEFESLIQASNFYNTHSSSISACCKDKLKFSGRLPDGRKLVWKYIG